MLCHTFAHYVRTRSLYLSKHASCCPTCFYVCLQAPPSASERSPEALLTRHLPWDGQLWQPLSSFPSLTHLALQGWMFTGAQGRDIGLLTQLRRLDIENVS